MTRKSLTIIVLGLIIRVILVNGTDYPVIYSFGFFLFLFKEHETEHGRHWNLFIALTLLPIKKLIIQVLLHPVILHFPMALVGVVVGLSTNISLTHAPRCFK